MVIYSCLVILIDVPISQASRTRMILPTRRGVGVKLLFVAQPRD